MNALVVILFVGLACVGLGLAYYGWTQYRAEATETERTLAELEHERRMAREEREYEEVMAYAERDSQDRDDERR